MSALPLRRAFLLIVPIALLLSGCDGGEGKPGVPPGVGDTNPAAGEYPEPATGLPPCSAEQVQVVQPCYSVGTVCTTATGSFVPWIAPGPVAPEITWTYPCAPDHFSISISGPFPQYAYEEHTIASGEIPGEAARLLTYSWKPTVRLQPGHYHYEITAYVGPAWKPGRYSIYTTALCEDLQNSPPVTVFPKDGDVFKTPEEFTEGFEPVNFEPWIQERGFNWGDMWGDVWSEECTYWEAQVSTDSTFATGVMPIETGYPVYDLGGVVNGVVEWCHTYYWRVREYLPDIVGPWSEVSSFRIAPPEGWDHCLLSAGVIEAIATTNATCRLGPGTAYGISSYVPAGESHPVEGRNANGTWLKLQDLGCYIYRELLALEVGGTPFPGGADVSDLMSVLPDPPLPTETPLPVCKSSMGPDDCVRYGGAWKQSFAGGPSSCACP